MEENSDHTTSKYSLVCNVGLGIFHGYNSKLVYSFLLSTWIENKNHLCFVFHGTKLKPVALLLILIGPTVMLSLNRLDDKSPDSMAKLHKKLCWYFLVEKHYNVHTLCQSIISTRYSTTTIFTGNENTRGFQYC